MVRPYRGMRTPLVPIWMTPSALSPRSPTSGEAAAPSAALPQPWTPDLPVSQAPARSLRLCLHGSHARRVPWAEEVRGQVRSLSWGSALLSGDADWCCSGCCQPFYSATLAAAVVGH